MSSAAPTDEGPAFGVGLPERERAALLRRVDWRFLLGRPVPEKVWSCAELLAALQEVSRSVADPASSPVGDCDLAALVDPDDEQMRRAWTALRPGGWCYVEWRAGGRPGALRRRLQAAGFGQVRGYAPWQGVVRPRFWLPLGSPAGLRYFRRRPLRQRNALVGLLHGARRLGATLANRLWLVRPLCLLAGKPAYGAPAPLGAPAIGAGAPREVDPPGVSEGDCFRRIRAQWPAWGLGETPQHLSWILLTGGWRSNAKVVGLVVAEPDPRPRLVVKMARVPESMPGLLREAKTLELLHALDSGGLPGVPRLLFVERSPCSVAVGQTAHPGVPLSEILVRRNYAGLAMNATAWLASLAAASRDTHPGCASAAVIEPALQRFQEMYGAILDPGMLRETEQVLAGIAGLPAVCEHRDFIPWNVLVASDGQLGVVDWEGAEPSGLPGLDLIYFLSYLGFVLDRARLGRIVESVETYRAGTSPATFTGAIHRECLDEYLRRAGLDRASVHPLRLLTWIVHSRFEYQRLVADFGASPGTPVLRRSALVRLWEEELRHGPES